MSRGGAFPVGPGCGAPCPALKPCWFRAAGFCIMKRESSGYAEGGKPSRKKGSMPVLKRIFCACALVAAMGTLAAVSQETEVFTADKHKEMGLECSTCHGEEAPTATVPGTVCLPCHESLEAVAARTKDFTVNPHENHITLSQDLECTQCHNGHKATEPMCLNCHAGMKFK